MSAEINSLITAFTFIFLAELGDKTQITTIILAAKLCSPMIVLIGIMLAFSIITGISIVFGVKNFNFYFIHNFWFLLNF
ncbi:MAG: TMEM165/GDT1 family protein [Nitrososphaerota archaeon]